MLQETAVRNLQEMITSQAEVAVANYFADNAMLAYEDEKPITVLNERAVMAYEACKDSVKDFMTSILLADMLVNKLNYAECMLIMPDGECRITIGVDYNITVADKMEVVRTKIGSFDSFTWEMLCNIPKEQNPLKIFYEHIEEYLNFIMLKLGWTESDLSKRAIDSELMDEYHIQEPVQIHPLINLYYGMSKFCNDGGKEI